MKHRTLDEMITYFNQQVSEMDIDRKYKMALLGMITAIGYENKKQERKKGEWIYGEDEYGIDGYHCDKCGFFVPWDYAHKFINYIEDYKLCPNCGADMRGEHHETT